MSSNGINFSMSTHRFHPSRFEYSPAGYQLFGNDVIFSSSHV